MFGEFGEYRMLEEFMGKQIFDQCALTRGHDSVTETNYAYVTRRQGGLIVALVWTIL